jgi:hypothetical protein
MTIYKEQIVWCLGTGTLPLIIVIIIIIIPLHATEAHGVG